MYRQLNHLVVRSSILTAFIICACSSGNQPIAVPNFSEATQSSPPPSGTPGTTSSSPVISSPSTADAQPNNSGNQTPPCSNPPLTAKQTPNVQYQMLNGVDPKFNSLDIYMPAVTNVCEGVPIVIWVHGGAWMIGDKANADSEVKANHFNSMGYGFVSVNYRLSPVVTMVSQIEPNRIKFPDHPNDVGAAVAWIHKNIKTYGGNPEKLAILGHSAGAHLAALVALDQRYIEKVDATWSAKALRCLGSYDTESYNINEFMKTATGQQLAFYLNAFGADQAVWTTASPINFIKEYGMAIQLAKRGDSDRQAQLENFKTALEEKKNSVSVIDASILNHEQVNSSIGAKGEQVMTPFVSRFLSEGCFPK